jgi:NCAIR mutase (PurE)-related protein
MSAVAAEFVLDFERRDRIGLDEAVFSAGKSPAQLDAILAEAAAQGASMLLTRLDPSKFIALDAALRDQLDYCPVSETAVFGTRPEAASTGRVAVVCAGTSDVPVAWEAVRTLAFNGEAAPLIADVGVAGLWRLTRRLDEIRATPVIIVAAGMDAALPSVLAGLVPGVVIAVPTSVGYGVAAGGRAALDAILSSCAPGITVVNIDNGYGAACAALRLLGAAHRIAEMT